MTDGVICEAEQDRLILTLDRPAKLNAANGAMIRALTEAILSVDATTGVVVIRGNGPRAFCVGSDLEEFQQGPDAQKDHICALRSLVETVYACPVPVVASVHGFTLGTGAMIAALADIVIASSNLSFGAPEMHHKMYPALVHAVLLERVTNSIACDLCTSARIISATEALNLGLVSEIVPEDD
ncbi:enoyl-CoA hydratase/isomerase family protein, partial [Hoeflea sp.]|uniref:enoyl-CoA hydratase/isomerase family protein n=1 Tax=Hoeflea sp. TaxID=1940281 RepID=UPI00199E8092